MLKSPLLTQSFVRLWVGNTASGLATWALPFVLGLAIVDGTLDATSAGLALAARTLGFLLAMPISGVLSDRGGPRPMILRASLLAALGVPMVAWAMSGGALALQLIGAAIAGMGQGASRPAYQVIIPLLVSPQHRQPANAALTFSIRVTSLVGPSLATLAVLLWGTQVTLGLIAVLWLLSAFLPPSAAVPAQKRDTLTLRKFGAELLDGLVEARRHRWFVAGLAALTFVIAFGFSTTSVLLPEISNTHFGGPALLAASVTAYTLGALIGAVVISRWSPRNIGWVALVGLAAYGLVPLSLLAPQGMILPLIAYFLAGVGIELFNVPWFTATQREIPADKLARVSSVDFLFSYGLAPVGLALIAPLASTIGAQAMLLLCGLVCLAVPLIAMMGKGSRRFSDNDR